MDFGRRNAMEDSPVADDYDSENSLLARLVLLKRDCLIRLAHDARNAVSMLQGADRLASSRGDASFLRHALEKAQRQFHETARSVENLLDVSAIVRGAYTLERECVDLVHLAERATGAAAAMLEERRQTLELGLPDTPIYLQGDAQSIERGLVNLVAAASQNSPVERPITLSVCRQDGVAVVTVHAEAGELPVPAPLDAYLKALEEAPDRAYDPHALGMSLTRHAVEAMGGRVVSAEDGKSLRLEFPAAS